VRTLLIALALFALPLGAAHGQDKPADAAARQNARGAQLLKEGKLEEAVAELQKAAQAAPSSAVIQGNLAYAYDRLGKTDEAIAAYRKVLDLDAGNAVVRNNLAVLYSKQGQYDDAIRELQDVLDRDPANAAAKTALDTATKNKAVAQARQDQVGAALKTSEARPQDAWAAFEAARTYARFSDQDNAVEWLARAFALGFDQLDLLNADPSLVNLRKDPRYLKLLEERRAR
jgi:tetratricopeptide (TPR) repeat protein